MAKADSTGFPLERQRRQRQPAPSAPGMFSFAAAGWLKTYYLGVGKALQQLGLHKEARFAGASAGSLVSVALALDLDFDAIFAFVLECAQQVRSRPVDAFALRKFLEQIIENQLAQHPDPCGALGNRVEIAVTVLPSCRGKRISQFEDLDHLRKALLASCCMSPLAGWPFRLKGEWVFDGGLADFQPLLCPRNTVSVSPFFFSKGADIIPSKPVGAWWALYPMAEQGLRDLYAMGAADVTAWAHKVAMPLHTPPRLRHVKLAVKLTKEVPCADADAASATASPSATARLARALAGAQSDGEERWDAQEVEGDAGCSSGSSTAGSVGSDDSEAEVASTNSVRSRMGRRQHSSRRRHGRSSRRTRSDEQHWSLSVAFVTFCAIRLFVPLLLQPLVLFFMVMELAVRSALHFGAMTWHMMAAAKTAKRRLARRALARGSECLKTIFSPRLLLRGIPVFGAMSPFGINHAKLSRVSIVYRLAIGVL